MTGKVLRIGGRASNLGVQGYWNEERPVHHKRANIQMFFPK